MPKRGTLMIVFGVVLLLIAGSQAHKAPTPVLLAVTLFPGVLCIAIGFVRRHTPEPIREPEPVVIRRIPKMSQTASYELALLSCWLSILGAVGTIALQIAQLHDYSLLTILFCPIGLLVGLISSSREWVVLSLITVVIGLLGTVYLLMLALVFVAFGGFHA